MPKDTQIAINTAANDACPKGRAWGASRSTRRASCQSRTAASTTPTAPSSSQICSGALWGWSGMGGRAPPPSVMAPIWREASKPHPSSGRSASSCVENCQISTRCWAEANSHSACCQPSACISRTAKGVAKRMASPPARSRMRPARRSTREAAATAPPAASAASAAWLSKKARKAASSSGASKAARPGPWRPRQRTAGHIRIAMATAPRLNHTASWPGAAGPLKAPSSG